MDCWCPAPSTGSDRTCRACGARTVAVELLTVKAALTHAALARLSPGHHRFCAEPACAVVYTDENGLTYSTDDLRVRVWQKEPSGSREICYCFGETEATIRTEIEQNGRTAAIERVRGHIAAKRCACDIRNPRGACCLGDLLAAVKRITVARENECGGTADLSNR